MRDRMSLGEAAVFLFVAAAFAMLVFSVYGAFRESSRCEARGGTFYCGRGSTCLCLAPGIVIPLGDR